MSRMGCQQRLWRWYLLACRRRKVLSRAWSVSPPTGGVVLLHRLVGRNLRFNRADPPLHYGQPSPLRCVLLSPQGLATLRGPQFQKRFRAAALKTRVAWLRWIRILFFCWYRKTNPYCAQMRSKSVCDAFLSPARWSAKGEPPPLSHPQRRGTKPITG